MTLINDTNTMPIVGGERAGGSSQSSLALLEYSLMRQCRGIREVVEGNEARHELGSRPVVRCAAAAETALSVCGDHRGHVIPAD